MDLASAIFSALKYSIFSSSCNNFLHKADLPAPAAPLIVIYFDLLLFILAIRSVRSISYSLLIRFSILRFINCLLVLITSRYLSAFAIIFSLSFFNSLNNFI